MIPIIHGISSAPLSSLEVKEVDDYLYALNYAVKSINESLNVKAVGLAINENILPDSFFAFSDLKEK